MLITSPVSHLDHSLSIRVVGYLLGRFHDRVGFFIETIELPPELGTVPCGLYGPAMGDPPMVGPGVHAVHRGSRTYPSRVVYRGTRQTRFLTVIAGPHGDEPCVLYTAYGGPAAPRELGDPSIAGDGAELAKSRAFWEGNPDDLTGGHALAFSAPCVCGHASDLHSDIGFGTGENGSCVEDGCSCESYAPGGEGS